MKLEKWLESLKTDAEPTVDEAIEHIGHIFPLLKEFKTTVQDPIWHAEGDVHIHTDMVLQELYSIFKKEYIPSKEERQILILAAILHDIAKPLVTKEVDGRIKASRHEVVGRDYLAFKLLELNLEFSSYKEIINLVGYHQRPKLLVIKEELDYKYFALSRYFDPVLMYYLELADLRGRTCEDKEDTIMYLDEYLKKTTEILLKYRQEKIMYQNISYREYRWFDYLLMTGQINSILEAPQKLYERLKPENSFKFVLLCGIPGVGKSTYIKTHYSNYEVISMDDIRAELGDRRDQSRNKEVARIAKERLKEQLRLKKNIVWDATSIRKEHREDLLQLAEKYGAFTALVTLLDKESNIRKRNKDREFDVPDEVITRMISNFQFPSPDEAALVLYVNVGETNE